MHADSPPLTLTTPVSTASAPPIVPMELWAFLENSDFKRRKDGQIKRWDEVKLIKHDQFLVQDYALLNSIGCVGVRDAARWYLTHPAPGVYDWTWMDAMVEAANNAGLHLYIDLWHYGYPDWMNLMSPAAVEHFADFAEQIARRYPTIRHYCVSNEPSLLIQMGGVEGRWSPFQRRKDPTLLRQQICRMMIAASEAILRVRADALLIVPEPWHATNLRSEDEQAAVLDTVMGLRDPHLGGRSEYVSIVGLNHYRDSTLPPFHQLILNAQRRYPEKTLWFTETSGPPRGWQQTEWFWWMMAEVRLAQMAGVCIPVFTWAPAISMYDWLDDTRLLENGIWTLDRDGNRLPNGYMIEAIELARQYGYLR
ncbi:MAG: cellulase family glycosylhydrolase [bacterium]|nr:cellulase family glycosylhydrolase [bacterium]